MNISNEIYNQDKPSIFARTVWSMIILMFSILLIQKFSDFFYEFFPFFYTPSTTVQWKYKIDGRVIFGMLTIFFALYWNNRSIYVSKWTYLANFYNKISLETSPSDDSLIEKYYRNGLFVFDCIKLKFFKHSSFQATIYDYIIVSQCYIEYKKAIRTKMRVRMTNDEIEKIISLSCEQLDKNFNSEGIHITEIEQNLNKLHSDIEWYLSLRK